MGTLQAGDKESVPGGFHSSSGPEALPSFGCSKLGFSRRACRDPETVCICRGNRESRSIGRGGPLGWHVLPAPSAQETPAFGPRPAQAPGI